jgi:hypothetical protein
VCHQRQSSASVERLWRSACAVQLSDTALLGRLVSWRLPGTRPELTFDELFRQPPFVVLEQAQTMLVCGLVGRIWTLRRDYPHLEDPEQFLRFAQRGTARVIFAHWVEPGAGGGSALLTEARVEAIGVQGRLGVKAIRPLVGAFQGLVASEGLQAAVRRAEGR